MVWRKERIGFLAMAHMLKDKSAFWNYIALTFGYGRCELAFCRDTKEANWVFNDGRLWYGKTGQHGKS